MFFTKKYKNVSEAELIAFAKEGKQNAFGELYERNYEKVYSFVFKRLGGNEELAGDLTSQSFIKAMGSIFKYEDRGYQFSTWLIRIAQNEVNMYFRSNKSKKTVDISIEQLELISDELGQKIEQEELIERLLSHINELKEEEKDLIELRFFQGFSFKEIADIYASNEAAIKMKTYRLIERIQKQFKAS